MTEQEQDQIARAITTERQDAIALLEQMGQRLTWQPISSAPKDGTPILVVTTSERVREAWWAIPYEGAREGWWKTMWGNVLAEHVTLWMPLPPAPAAPDSAR